MNMHRMNQVMNWLKARHAKREAVQKRLAFHYLAKSGIFPSATQWTGEHFHLLHNWLLGPCRGNVWGEKALEAWHRVGNGHYERESRIWSLVYRKYGN